ncbi:MAG: EAL domain-containing protein [Wenzhouxiangellaceae bacterium]
MRASRRHILYSAPGRVPWLIAATLLALLLSATVMLSRAFERAEEREIDRYFNSIATHIQTDLLGGAEQQAAIQSRMATRLAFDGPFDQAAWQSDAARLIGDHPHYQLLAVLDGDFTVRWLAGGGRDGIVAGEVFPLTRQARARLAREPADMNTIALEPLTAATPEPAILFVTPIMADGQVVNWLAAVMQVPASIRAMLTGFYLRDVALSGDFDGTEFAIPGTVTVDDIDASYHRIITFELGNGRSELNLGVALRPEKIAEMRTALPRLILLFGFVMTLLLVVAALLAMAAARQARVLSGANRNLQNEIRDRELAERELEFLVTHDSLTGLPNRQGMLRHLERAIHETDPRHSLAVFFIDLDQFKDINETLGHHLGDELLRQIPERLARELDDDDMLGRLGGDEFLVVAKRRDRERVIRLADRLLGALDKPFRIEEHQLFISASIGLAFADSASASPGELIQNADAALFRAKQMGRNQHAMFTPEMFFQVEYRLNLSRDIRQALDNEQFRIAYQPIVDLDTLEICGVEALMRWPHKDGYNVPPRDFIRVAEETGMVHRLSQYALSRAVQDLADWQKNFDNPPWLAVNISGAQFREAEFVRDLSVLLHHHRIAPDQLHLEITEEVLIENLARNRDILDQLDEIGMPIVVDDFGIGYSSLAYIKNFPISTIKIDQGFIRGIQEDADDRAITRTICDLSHELSLKTVAEGIEQPGQLELLRGYGCDFGQGFLFMHAVGAEEISSLLAGPPPWSGLVSVSGDASVRKIGSGREEAP